MNKSVEKQYYDYLEKIITNRKKNGLFFPIGTRDYEMDLTLLLEHVQRKNPHLIDKLLDNYVDISSIESLKNASEQELKKFISKTPKGTIAHIKNSKGESIYILNNGKHQKLQIIHDKLKKRDIENLKKSVFSNVLKKDIKHIYNKIHKKELKKAKNRNITSVFNNSNENIKKITLHSTNRFEETFMNISRQWGTTASPTALAGAYISTMSNKEKNDVLDMFKTKGINSPDKLCKYLNDLVDKAHSQEVTIEREMFRTVQHKKYQQRSR